VLEVCIYQGNETLLNLSTMATLGTEESGHCKVVAVVESFLTRVNVRMGTKKVTVAERWRLAEVQL